MFVKETTLFYHKFTNFKRVARIVLGGVSDCEELVGVLNGQSGSVTKNQNKRMV